MKKQYELDVHDLGWRNAEILMLVENGKTNLVAQGLMEKFDRVIGTSLRINTASNLAVYVGFRDSEELHELMEELRGILNVSNLEWSEIVSETGNRNRRLAHLIFNSS